ncbi:MAG TPA: flagellar hook-length control protein FliK, partial [Clostridia bacterium]|nr:flagellar hook-length control protein FliK [Clostridia bacterium]
MVLCGARLQCGANVGVDRANERGSGYGRQMAVSGRSITAHTRRAKRPESFGPECAASIRGPEQSWPEVLRRVETRVRGSGTGQAVVSEDRAGPAPRGALRGPEEGPIPASECGEDRIRSGEGSAQYATTVDVGSLERVSAEAGKDESGVKGYTDEHEDGSRCTPEGIMCAGHNLGATSDGDRMLFGLRGFLAESGAGGGNPPGKAPYGPNGEYGPEVNLTVRPYPLGDASAGTGREVLQEAGVAGEIPPLGANTALPRTDETPSDVSDEAVLGTTSKEGRVSGFSRLPLERSQAGSTAAYGDDLRSTGPYRSDGLRQDRGVPDEHHAPSEHLHLPNGDGSRPALRVTTSEGVRHGTAAEGRFWVSPIGGNEATPQRGTSLTGESPSLTTSHIPLQEEDDVGSSGGYKVAGSDTKFRPVLWESHPGLHTDAKSMAVSTFRNDVSSDLDATSVIDSMARAIKRAYDRGVDRITVQVRTADNPKVTVEVFAHGSEVTARFSSLDERVLVLLESNVNLLKESLAGQGLIFTGAQFTLHRDGYRGAS